ncbi:flagellar hook protein FlgE [Candidatus Villigracilis saccharophilus]|uniref:flagellar hook protein FlgE n=1 Tax=Candidatus Villigracilis saccharophilus TaxID=3140684 RepID=UPI0031365868|nr:flagellar hook protein FlgE [Anaerolineales bacterium]
MIRSMYTAISSLNLQQKYLDVVSNNLANSNTIGFKASRVLSQDQFSQMMSPGSSPTATQGGVNPIQIGLGVSLGYISSNFTQGVLQSTGRNMDLGIQGDGFFIYGNENRRYSREGSMSLDMDGYLVNSASGLRTQGWLADASGAIDNNIPVDDISIVTDNTLARATATVNLGGNLSAGTALNGTYNVTMGVYDSLGALQTATVQFTRGATAGVTPNITTQWSWALVNDPATAVAEAGGGTITFDENGQYVSDTPGAPIVLQTSTGADAFDLTIDFSKLTMLSATSTVAVTSQDGLPAGTVTDVYISPNDGIISLMYSNGMSEQVGQVALARFNNPTGLMKADDTTFLPGLNSGDPQIGAGNTGGRGSIAASYLEASNVDMAQEFTNMILAQRGFQASSRVITTSDEILQELVNLKR